MESLGNMTPQMWSNKNDTLSMSVCTGKCPWGFHCVQRREGDGVNLSSMQWLVLKANIQMSFYGHNGLYLGAYMYI